jgi:hypothetical protein
VTVRDLLRLLAQMLAAFPTEVAAALWRLLLLLLLLLLMLLRYFWELVEWIKRGKEAEPPRPNHCCEVPPNIKRKPDPCLYSQFYLLAQGLSVTWDNPDIWLTLPDGTPVDSGQLQPGTDYAVHARIHDASFDPALATEVRCFYRPWSFNSPDRVPIELNADGTERVIVIHIPPWQSETVVFHWKTPNQANMHWCLQVECRHPDDKNPNNNLGQENTQVLGGPHAAQLSTRAVLVNPTGRHLRARVAVDQYVIPNKELTLKLDTLTRHLRRKRPLESIRRLMITRDERGGLRTYGAAGPVMISYAYRGFEQLRPANDRGAMPLDPAWNATVNGELVRPAGHVVVDLAPNASLDLPISLTVPAGAAAGTRHDFNVVATTDRGKLLGGVTLRVEVS